MDNAIKLIKQRGTTLLEALVATAMGLFAAIPAVIAFNKYTSELETISQSTLIFSEELASIFYKQSIKK